MNVYKVERNNPLVPLMLGITFVHLACQKFSSRKHSLVVQASAFLQNYAKLRGQCHETYYNLGRAMHQLGMNFSILGRNFECYSLTFGVCFIDFKKAKGAL